MTLLTYSEITAALTHLGELAAAQGQHIELLVVGGAAMVLAYQARNATHDVDAVILAPRDAQAVRALAEQVAHARGWPADWLNDAVKGYVVGVSRGPVLLTLPGLTVRAPTAEQLLAMKLSAWRDKVDIDDARRLLRALAPPQPREALWQALAVHLVPGRELKARYAFEDLWESEYGND